MGDIHINEPHSAEEAGPHNGLHSHGRVIFGFPRSADRNKAAASNPMSFNAVAVDPNGDLVLSVQQIIRLILDLLARTQDLRVTSQRTLLHDEKLLVDQVSQLRWHVEKAERATIACALQCVDDAAARGDFAAWMVDFETTTDSEDCELFRGVAKVLVMTLVRASVLIGRWETRNRPLGAGIRETHDSRFQAG